MSTKELSVIPIKSEKLTARECGPAVPDPDAMSASATDGKTRLSVRPLIFVSRRKPMISTPVCAHMKASCGVPNGRFTIL